MNNQYPGIFTPRHIAAIRCALARFRLRADDRDDIEQDIAVVAVRGSWTPHGVAVIAHRMAIAILKARDSVLSIDDIQEPEIERRSGMEEREQLDIVRQALRRLDDRTRKIILARLDGRALKAIAHDIGTSHQRVAQIEGAARKKLRALLQNRDPKA